MNTKIVFYITGIIDRQFIKNVYEVIVTSESIDESSDWVDDNISSIMDEEGFSFILDTVLLLQKSTNKECQSLTLIKSIPGELSFKQKRPKTTKLKQIIQSINLGENKSPEEILNKLNQELEILTLQKETLYIQKETIKYQLSLLKKRIEETTTKLKKEYDSCWIQPNGTVIKLGFAQHNEWAHDYLDERDGRDWFKHRSAYEVLQDEGWVRVLGWTDPPTWCIPDRITPKQRVAIKEYCQSQGCDLPDELNSI